MELDTIINTLEKSIDKNSEKPLTNTWLLNILKQANRKIKKLEDEADFYPDPNFD